MVSLLKMAPVAAHLQLTYCKQNIDKKKLIRVLNILIIFMLKPADYITGSPDKHCDHVKSEIKVYRQIKSTDMCIMAYYSVLCGLVMFQGSCSLSKL